MKYKVYPLIFILSIITFMISFGGILETDNSIGYHINGSFKDFKYFSNNMQAQLTQEVKIDCWSGDKSCNKEDYFEDDHFISTITIKKFGTVVETFTDSISSLAGGKDNMGKIITNFTTTTPGDFTVDYKINCKYSGSSSRYIGGVEFESTGNEFKVIEGLEGEFDVQTIQIVCGENNSTFTYSSEHFNGDNYLSLQGTTGSLSLNVAADIAVTDYPCLEDSYSFNESGSFTVTETELTISYTDGAATASRTFKYLVSEDQLWLGYSDADTGDAIYITLNNVAELASN